MGIVTRSMKIVTFSIDCRVSAVEQRGGYTEVVVVVPFDATRQFLST